MYFWDVADAEYREQTAAEDRARKYARGAWQFAIACELIAGQTVVNPLRMLSGVAARYKGGYRASWSRLLERLEHDYIVVRVPGPRGGEHGATYALKERKT